MSVTNQSQDSKLAIGHVNVYHLYNKVPDVSRLLSNSQLHLLGLSETRLGDMHSDRQLAVPNYHFIRKDATRAGQTGLGV